jgi:hypothetical protein
MAPLPIINPPIPLSTEMVWGVAAMAKNQPQSLEQKTSLRQMQTIKLQ